MIECFKAANLQLVDIRDLLKAAEDIVGKPEKIKFEDDIVGIIESRDGTIMDVVRRVTPQKEIHEVI